MTGNLLATPPWIGSQEQALSEEELANNELYNGYDAVVIGLGFHHFVKWAEALEKLSHRVKKGGVIGIVDLTPDLDVSFSLPLPSFPRCTILRYVTEVSNS